MRTLVNYAGSSPSNQSYIDVGMLYNKSHALKLGNIQKASRLHLLLGSTYISTNHPLNLIAILLEIFCHHSTQVRSQLINLILSITSSTETTTWMINQHETESKELLPPSGESRYIFQELISSFSIHRSPEAQLPQANLTFPHHMITIYRSPISTFIVEPNSIHQFTVTQLHEKTAD